MCGLTGILTKDKIEEGTLHSMIGSIRHRGPDAEGVWYDKSCGIGLAHARLSILDLSPAGSQPMHSANDQLVIVFNGEIYNHLEIRNQLADQNVKVNWKGHSDTETLLAAFEVWGIEETLKKSVGMFALCVWNKTQKTVTLARDRFGEKPLYYGWLGNSFVFSSELKALKAHPSFRVDIDRISLSKFIRYSYVPAPDTIYVGIKKLLPGTFLVLRQNDRSGFIPEAKPYWSSLNTARNGIRNPFRGSEKEAIVKLENILTESVKLQQISDVPLGAFLSGGIDSSTIVALMQAHSRSPIHTFTIGFNEKQYDESRYAQAVADHLKTHHTSLYVSPEEARNVIPNLPFIYDEPFADSSQIPTFLVSQLAKKSVTVCLSGDAGDEVFGGYNRYNWVKKVNDMPIALRSIIAASIKIASPEQWNSFSQILSPIIPKSFRVDLLGNKLQKLASIFSGKSPEHIYSHLVSAYIWEDPIVIHPGNNVIRDRNYWDDLYDFDSLEHKMMLIDTNTYLPDDILQKVDRAAMAVSLETRVPFLDHRLFEFSWTLPLHMKIKNGRTKWILRQLLYKHVPKELIERPKMGFGVPIDLWLRGPLKEWAENYFCEQRLKDEGFFNYIFIREKWKEHLSGKYNWQSFLWNVLMFQAWYESHRTN
jgi:asparagine synthase (glutamine-hydrolysing)